MICQDIKSIFLVDDDDIANFLNKIFIEKLNLDLEVQVATNGEQALDLILDKNVFIPSPCLLLLDINMPRMNGWQFLEHYDKLADDRTKEEIVIVMLTSSEAESDMVKAQNSTHITEFVTKPLSENTFSRLINKHFTQETIL